MDIKYGQMVAFTKDIGNMIKQMEEVDSFTPMVTYMKVNGSMTRPMAAAPIST